MSIELRNVSHIYSKNSPFEKIALHDISLKIETGDFVGLIGHTGSGKSTLIQHINGLLKPTDGQIIINGIDITAKDVKLSDIRRMVGLVFQYPEYQLFEETVYKDIAYGPKNIGMSEDEIKNKVYEVISIVGLKESVLEKSPFELSGGQKRRVAIAGILAMEPDILILDEPTAGLDPKGRDDILSCLKKLHKEKNITIVLVSHSMEDIAKTVNNVIVMADGSVKMSGSVSDIFKRSDELKKIGLNIPQISMVVNSLIEKGINIDKDTFTVEKAADEIEKYIRGVHK